MPRGGYRGGGRPSLFKHQPTRTIRVPVELADEVLEIAKTLDRGESVELASTNPAIAKVSEILTEALTFKSNAGGAIKIKIREALALLENL